MCSKFKGKKRWWVLLVTSDHISGMTKTGPMSTPQAGVRAALAPECRCCAHNNHTTTAMLNSHIQFKTLSIKLSCSIISFQVSAKFIIKAHPKTMDVVYQIENSYDEEAASVKVKVHRRRNIMPCLNRLN